MGSYVSVPWCEANYGVVPNCSWDSDNTTVVDGKEVKLPPYTSIGGQLKGMLQREFEGDPDIAGIGILAAFVGVTGFAIIASLLSVMWQASKVWLVKRTYTKEEKKKNNHFSFSDILETLVLGCSDQQVVTGAAYALTLRYWRGCTISAYHYNIVANMMLLTCATHLMSVTIVRNYWKYPLVAIIRVLCISGVFIVTGLLMTNQNADVDTPFPTGVPAARADSLILLPAACFQSERNKATDTFKESTSSAKSFFISTIAKSTPRNLIQGWNWYVIILLFYGAAIIAEIVRVFRRGASRPGWRGRVGKKVRHCIGLATPLRKVIQNLFLIYLLAGVGISCAASIISARYIFDLRSWVDESGWMEADNPENDATSFGQLVPLFSTVLVIFSLLQIVSEKITRRHNRKHAGDEPLEEGGTIEYLDPSNYNLMSPPPEKNDNGGSYFGAAGVLNASSNTPPRVDLDHQSSWGSTFSPSTLSVAGGGGGNATPKPSQLSRFSAPPSANNKVGYTAVPTQPPQAQTRTSSGSASPPRRQQQQQQQQQQQEEAHDASEAGNISPVSSRASVAGPLAASSSSQSRTLTEARPGGLGRSAT
ncbi:hypothetical protein F5B20DRAFT_582202 [Whalleya microplaca]|nr:hypothetical protein F5B20DRAFT_582202 [Whalleya microplaca]